MTLPDALGVAFFVERMTETIIRRVHVQTKKKYLKDLTVKIGDLLFEMFISHQEIQERTRELAMKISNDDESLIFVPVMTGAFYFSSSFLSYYSRPYQICCVTTSSYKGTKSTGSVEIIHHKDPAIFEGKKVVILEDIIDTGLTVKELTRELYLNGAREVIVVAMLFKPGKLEHDIPLHSVGFEIGDEFVIGFGLDYNESGRYLDDIYQLK